MKDTKILPIPHSINLRTLAGYKSTDGRIVRTNKLLRSGNLSELSVIDAEKLATLYGVVTTVDLRTDAEILNEPDVLPKNTSYYHLPVLPFSDHATFMQKLRRRFARPLEPTLQMYKKMLTDSHANAAYRDMFQLLINNTENDQAILIHCSAGKDRTGLAVMLIEAALGIPDETIRYDYMLSNYALTASEGLNQISQNNVYDRVEMMRNKPASDANLQVVFSLIHSEYQSWKNYLQLRLGLSATDLKTLRRIYLIKEGADL